MPFDAKTYLTQTGLKSLGFDFGPRPSKYGPVDGLDGKDTRQAVADFIASDLNPAKQTSVQHPSHGRQISQDGLDLVKHFESSGELKPGSKFLTAYKCPADVWTIGYGHTGLVHNDGTVKAGRVITVGEAEDLLRYDLINFCKGVEALVTVPLDDNHFAALVSFAFNVGTGNFRKSTLLKKVNANDFVGAADEFLKWNKAAGKVLAGLTRRRKSERNLFLGVKPFIVR